MEARHTGRAALLSGEGRDMRQLHENETSQERGDAPSCEPADAGRTNGTGSAACATFAAKADSAWRRLIPVPFCFMGMGIFRVWTETLYASGPIDFPAMRVPLEFSAGSILGILNGYSFFELFTAAALIVLAVLARKLAPLYRHPWAIVATLVCMVGAACANFASILAPQMASTLFWVSTGCGGVGMALILMLWSEFFGCINPLRVGAYYAASVALSCVVLWFFKGLSLWWLWAGTCLVPIVSLMCLWRAYATLGPEAYPTRFKGRFSFPWKPVAVVGLCTFVYAMRESVFSGALAMYSGVGAFAAALGAYVLIGLKTNAGTAAQSAEVAQDDDAGDPKGDSSFDFTLLYRVAIPLMLVSLLPLEEAFPAWGAVADGCAIASYTLLLIFIMVILSNLSYRYGVCALWLFAIERAVRLVMTQVGRMSGEALHSFSLSPALTLLLVAAMAAMLVAAAALMLSEKNISSSQWGVVLRRETGEGAGVSERNRLGVKCAELAQQAGLTPREEDVLFLLAQRKTVGEISRELYIGTNTVKTHSKHVYQKLGVHARSELLEMLGVHEQPSRG